VQHLSSEQLAMIREGLLSGLELLAADDHLAVCEECRAGLASAAVQPDLTELIAGLRVAAAAAERHLSYEQLQAYVDGNCSDADRMRLESHLAECARCQGEAEDLKEFAAGFQARRTKSTPYARYLIFGPIAAALLIGVILMRPHPQPVQLAVSLHDGRTTIGLDGQGRLVGADSAGPAERDLLLAALRDRRVAVSVPDGLRSHTSVLLGPESAEKRFRVLSPVGELVLKDQPEFRWEPLDKARGYTVQIFDADYQPVAASAQVAGTSWTPEHPLERGKPYVWQVTAVRDGSPVKAPQPPDAEARFQIVAGADAGAIEQAQQAQAGPFRMATLYAHAGLCREALGQMAALERENSNSALVQQMQADMTKQCDAGSQH
jgi:anti-sigma factor RsiW